MQDAVVVTKKELARLQANLGRLQTFVDKLTGTTNGTPARAKAKAAPAKRRKYRRRAVDSVSVSDDAVVNALSKQ